MELSPFSEEEAKRVKARCMCAHLFFWVGVGLEKEGDTAPFTGARVLQVSFFRDGLGVRRGTWEGDELSLAESSDRCRG